VNGSNLKWTAWLSIGLITIIGLIVLTAMRIMSPEPIIAISAVVMTAIFEEKKYEALDKSWNEWYKTHLEERKLEDSKNVASPQSPRMF